MIPAACRLSGSDPVHHSQLMRNRQCIQRGLENHLSASCKVGLSATSAVRTKVGSVTGSQGDVGHNAVFHELRNHFREADISLLIRIAECLGEVALIDASLSTPPCSRPLIRNRPDEDTNCARTAGPIEGGMRSSHLRYRVILTPWPHRH
jgi:hypothetical protein